MVNSILSKDDIIIGKRPLVIMRAYLENKLVAEQFDTKLVMRHLGDGCADFSATMEFKIEVTVDRVDVINKANVINANLKNGPLTMYPDETITVDQRIEIEIIKSKID